MSQTALYSAEQIEVFEGLTDVLKEYAKAAIRAAPRDLLVFSRDYFAQRVEAQRSQVPVTKDQLRALRMRLATQDSEKTVTREFLLRCCDEADVPRGDADRVLREMGSTAKENVPHADFVALCCCLLAESFAEAVSVVVYAWGGLVAADVFVQLVASISRRDPHIPIDTPDRLAAHLKQAGLDKVTEQDWLAFVNQK